jgi:hypothetical protein
MLYREIIAVCSEIHTKHINTLCGQNVELVNVKPGGTYSDRWGCIPLSTDIYKNFTCFQSLPNEKHSIYPSERPKY